MTDHIRVSEAVKNTLEQVKKAGGHTNFDSAVREVMMRADLEVIPPEEDGEDQEDESSGGGISGMFEDGWE